MDIVNILIPAGVLAGLGFLLGVLINVVSKVFYVEEDPAIEEVVELLPKYNCGACGHPGCKEMAISLLNKESNVMQCKPMKKEAADVLKEYLKHYFENKA
jgi:Na+-translocating ferredoxin:NAD+ oxidoreductase RNF subunit RnfB